MKASDIIKKAVFYVTVPKCVCCKQPLAYTERALCASCQITYQNSKNRDCGVCGKHIQNCRCPNAFLDSHFIHTLYKVTRYIKRQNNNPANSLIYSLKEDHRKDTVLFMAEELSLILSSFKDKENFCVTNIPRRRKADQMYGYDHAAWLAKETARLLNLPYVSTLKSHAKSAQKNLRGIDRKRNADFSLRRNVAISSQHVILIDDIVTTGSSMGAAAMALKGAGAKEIIGAAFAIAYHDPYISFQ